jgi:hypothetical protein
MNICTKTPSKPRRKRLYRRLVAAGLALAALVPASLGLTATASASTLQYTGPLCLTSALSQCLHGNGVGGLASLGHYTTAGTAPQLRAWYYSNWGADEMSDGHGNCLRANGVDHGVRFDPCNASDSHDFWVIRGLYPRWTLQNVGTGAYMGTWGTATGTTIYNLAAQSGFYTGWMFFS